MVARLIKLSVSSVVFLRDRIREALIKRDKLGKCVVLNYHVIPDDCRHRFEQQMRSLRKLARPVPALRRQAFDRGARYVAVTFDDAFCNFARNALPALIQHRIPVAIFVPTGYLGRKSAWSDYGGENPIGDEVLSVQQLIEIAKCDLVEVGSHTVNHADLVILDEKEARAELRGSKETLETLLGRSISGVAFPYGHFGKRELRLAREVGYNFIFSVRPDLVVSAFKDGLIGRVSVQPTDWPIEFRFKILGAYRWQGCVSEWKQKVLGLLGHRILARGKAGE